MRIISVINYKGGVGKTTLTANLGAELARRGKRVLLIDLDPQSSLTFSFFSSTQVVKHLSPQRSIKAWYDTFVDGIPGGNLGEYVTVPKEVNERIAERGGFLGLITSSLRLIDIDLNLLANAGMGKLTADVEIYRLRQALSNALGYAGLAQYDYVLIDCPPNFNVVTQSAIVASDCLLVPAKPDYLSTLGIENLLTAVERFVEGYNNQVRAYSPAPAREIISPTPLGVVFTMVRYKTAQPVSDHLFYMDRLRRSLPNLRIFRASVRENVAFGRESSNGLPVILHANITQNYYMELMELASEFLSHFADDITGKRAVA